MLVSGAPPNVVDIGLRKLEERDAAMPTTYLAHLGKVEIYYQGDRDTAVNVMWISSTGIDGADSTLLAALATDIGSEWVDMFAPYICNEQTILECTVTDWSSDTGVSGTHVLNVPGSSGPGPMPSQVCSLINWQVATRYRGGRPRQYVPAPSQGMLADNQHLTEVVAGGMSINAELFLGFVNAEVISGDPVKLVCFHRVTAHHPVASVEPIISGAVSPQLATQRRRLRRVG